MAGFSNAFFCPVEKLFKLLPPQSLTRLEENTSDEAEGMMGISISFSIFAPGASRVNSLQWRRQLFNPVTVVFFLFVVGYTRIES